MSTRFVPPSPDQWQGSAAQFTPPPPSSWQGPAQPVAQPYNFPKPTYKSPLPWPLGRMDEAVQDSIDWMADGVQRMIKANTLDEKLAGLHETVSGFFNTAGAPLVLQGLGTAPLRTAAGVALGLGTQKGAETVLPMLGAGPGTTIAGSDIAGIAAGMYGPDVVPAVGRGVVAAAPDVAKGTAKLGAGAVIAKVPIPEAMKFGAGLPLAYSGGRQVLKGLGKGFQAALTPAAGPLEAAPTMPEPAPYTPGGPGYPAPPPAPTLTSPEGVAKATGQARPFTPEEEALSSEILQNVEPQPTPPAPPAATPGAPEVAPTPPVAAPPATTTTPEAAFMEGQPAAARTPESLSYAQQLRDMLEGKPTGETFEEAARAKKVDTLANYLITNKIPLSMIQEFRPDVEWKMVADQAGVTLPSAKSIEAITAKIREYEAAAELPAGVSKMPPAQAEEAFQQAKKKRTR